MRRLRPPAARHRGGCHVNFGLRQGTDCAWNRPASRPESPLPNVPIRFPRPHALLLLLVPTPCSPFLVPTLGVGTGLLAAPRPLRLPGKQDTGVGNLPRVPNPREVGVGRWSVRTSAPTRSVGASMICYPLIPTLCSSFSSLRSAPSSRPYALLPFSRPYALRGDGPLGRSAASSPSEETGHGSRKPPAGSEPAGGWGWTLERPGHRPQAERRGERHKVA